MPSEPLCNCYKEILGRWVPLWVFKKKSYLVKIDNYVYVFLNFVRQKRAQHKTEMHLCQSHRLAQTSSARVRIHVVGKASTGGTDGWQVPLCRRAGDAVWRSQHPPLQSLVRWYEKNSARNKTNTRLNKQVTGKHRWSQKQYKSTSRKQKCWCKNLPQKRRRDSLLWSQIWVTNDPGTQI